MGFNLLACAECPRWAGPRWRCHGNAPRTSRVCQRARWVQVRHSLSTCGGPRVRPSKSRVPLRPTRLDVGQVVRGFPSRSPDGDSLKRTRPATCAQRRRTGSCPRCGRAASDSQGSRTARQAQGPPLLGNVAMHEHLRRSVDIPATNRECGHACPWALRITPEAQDPSGAPKRGGQWKQMLLRLA